MRSIACRTGTVEQLVGSTDEQGGAGVRIDQARNYLDGARARVEKDDLHLLMVDVSERCIAARLAMYLREYFDDFDVDVEYNRDGPDVKRLYDVIHDCPRDRDEGQSVLPDVIVHKRGKHDSNLLVIEMKKAPNQSGLDSDRRRIQRFRKQLDYKAGALVICKTGRHSAISVEWYE